jgi:hypothetical protein
LAFTGLCQGTTCRRPARCARRRLVGRDRYLRLSADTIKADLAAGQRLADIANATTGKSAQGLVDAIGAPMKAKLDAKVASNDLTATQESNLLAYLNAKVTLLVNGQWGWWHHNSVDND